MPSRPGQDPFRFHVYDYPGSAADPPWTPSDPQSSRGEQQFYSLVQDLGNLVAVGSARAVPGLVLNPGPGVTTGRRQTWELSFGNQGRVADRPVVMITGGVHAREWIGAEIAYLIAEYLIINYDPAAAPDTPAGHLTALVNTRNIRIIPMVNPDGNYHSVFGQGADDRLWRKNLSPLPGSGPEWLDWLGQPVEPFRNVRLEGEDAYYAVPVYNGQNGIPPGDATYQDHQLANSKTGVDLNRNMPTDAWGYDCGSNMWDPGAGTFFGRRRQREPEAANMCERMAAAGRIAVAIDYHSFDRSILYPSETARAGAADPDYRRTGEMLRQLIAPADQPYQLGIAGELTTIGKDATGTVADYAAQRHQARAFTIELDPATADEGGWQLSPEQIQGVFEANIRGALAAIEAPADEKTRKAVVRNYKGWEVAGKGNRVPPPKQQQ